MKQRLTKLPSGSYIVEGRINGKWTQLDDDTFPSILALQSVYPNAKDRRPREERERDAAALHLAERKTA